MNRPLEQKIKLTIRRLREIWKRTEDRLRFVAFSTGKDSLAMTAMLYEAVAPERSICLYSHHDLEFPLYLEYLEELRARGIRVETVRPFLGYFELMERGMGFVTLTDPWCVPMLVGTAFVGWLQQQGVRGMRSAVMFRGMTGSEYSRKYHNELEIYRRLDLPCVNPMLEFTRQEIREIIRCRYNLPLNPIYEHMNRNYCICCYTLDARRQAYSSKHFPNVCKRYYGQVEKLLFGSGLIETSTIDPKNKTREEQLRHHGFVHWRRSRMQDVLGAAKQRHPSGMISYWIRGEKCISPKHLIPLRGRWIQRGNELRFWDVTESAADAIVKRMINCLNCGFCVVECFAGRHFDRNAKALRIEGCTQCGRCLRLKFCMGWKHRFWRRIIREVR